LMAIEQLVTTFHERGAPPLPLEEVNELAAAFPGDDLALVRRFF
jgi:hypothetical protein